MLTALQPIGVCQPVHRDRLRKYTNTPSGLTGLQVVINTIGPTTYPPLRCTHSSITDMHTPEPHEPCTHKLGPEITAGPAPAPVHIKLAVALGSSFL